MCTQRQHATHVSLPDGPSKTKLGVAQLKSVKDFLLRHNQTTFKFLVSPISWAKSTTKPVVQDGWAGKLLRSFL